MKFILALGVVAASVPVVTLNNGVDMPMASAGTWQYKPAEAKQSCLDALAAGFNHFDTANDYNNQVGVGEFFTEAVKQVGDRSKLFLTTKVPPCSAVTSDCHAETAKLMQDDLDQLKVDYVDLMLIHFPPKNYGSKAGCTGMQGAWKAAEELYAANKTRAIGVSNYCPSCFDCLAQTWTVKPAVNQVQYHAGMGEDPEGLKSYLAKQNIVMQAYSPLGDGTSELITGDLVTTIGAAHGKTGAQVALKWVVQSGVPLSTKSTDPKYLAQDIDIFDWTLSDAEMAQLNAAKSPAGTPSFVCTK